MREYPLAQVLAAGGTSRVHVAAGTNYAEHGREVGIGQVFSFPKFAPPTPPLASIVARPGMLLDYETEICARFDRDLRSLNDFDEAAIGLFLCGDYTDRAVLTRLVDRNDLASGVGYTDAKSGPEFFPTGPYLVVPVDWRAFIARETHHDDAARRTTPGRLWGCDDCGPEADRWPSPGKRLAGAVAPRGRPVPLLNGGVLPCGSSVLTGTPDGIIFRPPTFAEKFGGFVAYAFGGFLSGRRPVDYVIERFLDRLEKGKFFLQPGDVVHHDSTHMGFMTISVR